LSARNTSKPPPPPLAGCAWTLSRLGSGDCALSCERSLQTSSTTERSCVTTGRRFSGSTSKVLTYGVNEGSGCAGNAGEGGSSSSGRPPNEGFPLMCVLRDPIAGTRPFLWALDLVCNQVATEWIKPRNILLLRD
jgi:hypothetical protein